MTEQNENVKLFSYYRFIKDLNKLYKKNPFNFELRVLLREMNLHEIDEIKTQLMKQYHLYGDFGWVKFATRKQTP